MCGRTVKHEFPTTIHQLLNPSGEMQSTEFELDRKHFPYFVIDKDLTLTLVALAGSPNPVMKWSINSGVNGLDKGKLDDILISLAYTASSSP